MYICIYIHAVHTYSELLFLVRAVREPFNTKATLLLSTLTRLSLVARDMGEDRCPDREVDRALALVATGLSGT